MKKALICGAGGFVGGHLVKKRLTDFPFHSDIDVKKEKR